MENNSEIQAEVISQKGLPMFVKIFLWILVAVIFFGGLYFRAAAVSVGTDSQNSASDTFIPSCH